MITAIVDTNVVVQAAISPKGASFQVLKAHLDRKYQLISSPTMLDEISRVLMIPHIRTRHTWSDAEIRAFVELLATDAATYPAQRPVRVSITRDPTDTKFLSLAEESAADYLVTQDRRHLLRLKQHAKTQIVTPARFLKELAGESRR
jgi:putative PIN family toxin of toxin-antitoxin system